MRSFRGSYANRGDGAEQLSSDVVPVTGLEPVRGRPQGILNPWCLPFHHTGKALIHCTTRGGRCQAGPGSFPFSLRYMRSTIQGSLGAVSASSSENQRTPLFSASQICSASRSSASSR